MEEKVTGFSGVAPAVQDKNGPDTDIKTFQTPRRLYQRQMSLAPVQNLTDLDILVKFEALSSSDKKFEIISKYVNNSNGLKESHGNLIVHKIYEINKADWSSFQETTLSPQVTESEKNLLLWYKTTAKGVQKLAQGKDDCVVFYDRMCRAFPESPRNMQQPLRQLILLCAVSMGKVHESPQGFYHWSMRGSPPPEHDSVKGVGKSVPNVDDCVEDDTFTVPYGKTVQNQLDDTHKLEFNEYIVFESKRIKVKYAVDVEVMPSQLRRQASFGTAI